MTRVFSTPVHHTLKPLGQGPPPTASPQCRMPINCGADEVLGRYPGLKDLIGRLPILFGQWHLTYPHFLTVAGAAQAWHLFPV